MKEKTRIHATEKVKRKRVCEKNNDIKKIMISFAFFRKLPTSKTAVIFSGIDS